jgi:MoaA/NifB/PqqE/SkfB family radical SAM enzyme
MMLIPPPEFLFLSINEVCNLRCQHCDYWRTKQPAVGVISLERQSAILAEFAELNPNGKVVICGGEPLLDVNTYFHVCSFARQLHLRTLSVVNGTLITDRGAANRLVLKGPDEISISLDSPTPEIHDRLRGRKGAFVQSTAALRMLLEARAEWSSSREPKIYAMGLLAKSTYTLIDDWYQLVLKDIGADKLKLNALQPSFLHTRIGQRRTTDEFFAKESQVDPDVLEQELKRCEAKYGLAYNPNWVRQVVAYFRGLQGKPDLAKGWDGNFTTEEHICNSPERNIMIDLNGRASLCFSNMFPHIEMKEPGDLRKFWEGSFALKAEMGKCNALCGISHSVRREHSSLKVLP